MKHKFIILLLSIAALILELLPNGVICIFTADNGVRIRKAYSFFNLIHIGYGNFIPSIIYILTFILIILALKYLFIDFLDDERRFCKYILNLSTSAFVFSLILLFFSGISYDSLISGLVCVVFLLEIITVNIVSYMGKRLKK